ncbi:MAG TPA: GntR family transcriptional regulator [Terracidiphilus sp.]|jgi:GntR family transcriptional regulator|nr:GntR family transcriptional regulator [Terracidiphilus sp.]
MRLWLNRTGEVSLREQLTTQVRLGILCRELKAGERLPSTRELARRFGIHANTASAAYKELEAAGWLEFRHGSGVYVSAARPRLPQSPELAVDELIGELVARARKAGATPELVRERVRRWLQIAPPGRWVVIEPDAELRRIVIAEMEGTAELPVTGCAPDECAETAVLDGAMAVVLPSKAATVRKLLPGGTELTVLEVHPVAPALGGYLPPPVGVLVAIASRWGDFQRIARTMLIAAGLSPEGLLVRDAAQPGWKRGLSTAAAVVCDVCTARELPRGCRAIVFRLLAEQAQAQVKAAEAAVRAGAEAALSTGNAL